MTEDYMNEDSLSVAVKADVAEEMKKWYSAFGWTLTEEQPDKVYIDLVHMKFARPHKIENKDRLQLLQVRFEMMLNLISRTKRRVNFLTALLCTGLFLLGAAIIGCGVVLALWASGTVFYVVCGMVIVAAGILFWVLSAFVCAQTHDYYTDKYSVYDDVLKENINSVVAEAASLTGYGADS
ncbi:MAG: hypothetical protein LUD19_04175 [Clostridia bacterium]|nr:hypothetical protein [Clostridia bacterium]